MKLFIQLIYSHWDTGNLNDIYKLEWNLNETLEYVLGYECTVRFEQIDLKNLNKYQYY